MLHLPHRVGTRQMRTPTWSPTSLQGRRESSRSPGFERFLPSSFSWASYSPCDIWGQAYKGREFWGLGLGLGSSLDVMSRWGGGESLGLSSGARAQPPVFLGAAKATSMGGLGHAGHVLGQQGPNPHAPVPLRASTAREKPPGSLLYPRSGCCFLPITIILARCQPSTCSARRRQQILPTASSTETSQHTHR